MNSHLIALEAKDLLDKVARKSKAKRILASGNSYMFKSLIPPILTGMTGYALADSTLPMTVKFLLSSVSFLAFTARLIHGDCNVVWTLQLNYFFRLKMTAAN